MELKDVIIDQLRRITAQINSNSAHKKANAQVILDGLLVIINENKGCSYYNENQAKISAVLKMAQDQIDSI